MPHRQAPLKHPANRIARIWLMTDPRFGDDLIAAIQKLPMGSGVVFRHYDLALDDRAQLFYAVRRVCRRRGHRLLIAALQSSSLYWDHDGLHNATHGKMGYRSASVHNLRELKAALRRGADILFISPVRKTRSHPGGKVLGNHGLHQLAMIARLHGHKAVIALGGMNRQHAAMHRRELIHGYAAIDAFIARAI